MTMTLIQTKTLGAAAASIEFTSIPQTFTDLVALCSLRGTESLGTITFEIRPNSVSTDLSSRTLQGDGSSASSFTQTLIGPLAPAGTSTANTFGSTIVYIPNYSGSTNKSFSIDNVTENNATTAGQRITAGLWSNTSAITSLQFTVTSNNIAIGSTISLYGITKGSDGIVTTS